MSSSNSMINPYLYLVFFNFNSNRCGRFVSTRERLEMSLMYIKLSYRISAFFCNDTQVYELEILESTTTYCSQWRHKHKVLITTYHKIQKKKLNERIFYILHHFPHILFMGVLFQEQFRRSKRELSHVQVCKGSNDMHEVSLCLSCF